MPNDINHIDAAVKFFLDQRQYGTDEFNNGEDIIYPSESDVFNRQGKLWNVLNISITPKIEKIEVQDEDLIFYDMPNLSASPFIDKNSFYLDNSLTLSSDFAEKLVSSMIDDGFITAKAYDEDDVETQEPGFTMKSMYVHYSVSNIDVLSSAVPVEKIIINSNETEIASFSGPYVPLRNIAASIFPIAVIPILNDGEQLKDFDIAFERKENSAYEQHNQHVYDVSIRIKPADMRIKARSYIKKLRFILGFTKEFACDDIQLKDSSQEALSIEDIRNLNGFCYFRKRRL